MYMYVQYVQWPLGKGNFQKIKIMLLPPPYLVLMIKKINYAIF